MKRNFILSISLFFLAGLAVAPEALADEFDQKTYFTTNQPLRIPGKVVLPAGTYVMRLVDVGSKNVVQVRSADETKVYATFFGVPRYLRQPLDSVRFEIGEAPEGLAEPIQAWYYPGKTIALEFVAPKVQPRNATMNSGN